MCRACYRTVGNSQSPMSLILNEVTTPSTTASALALFPAKKERRRILRVALWNSFAGMGALAVSGWIIVSLIRREKDGEAEISNLPVVIFAVGLVQLLIAIAQWVAFLTMKKQPENAGHCRKMPQELG